MKFGGTSTQDATAVTNVVEIIHSRLSQHPFIVISAIAQATNLLELAGKLAASGRVGEANDTLLKLFERHYTMVDNLVHDTARHRELRAVLGSSFRELEGLVDGVSILHELTPRTLDAFYCYGELLSSRIIAAALQERHIPAEWLDSKEFMITDENFTRALPMMDLVQTRLNQVAVPFLTAGTIPVTQGFIGVTLAGRRTTMGRESSDYSASIIGAVLHAEDIQIWTDVDGILTADPQVVTSPKKIKALSFEEAYELSYFGAKVLHPNTMLPAIEKNIPIHIYNSRRPQSSGTLVTSASDSRQSLLKSVAYKRNVVVINVVPRTRFSQYMLWEHIYSILTKYDSVASMTTTSEYSSSFVMDAYPNLQAIIHELEGIGIVSVLEKKGIVCVVGTNIRQQPFLVDRIFRSVSQYGIAMISYGASKSNLSMVLDDEAVPDAVRRIHLEFFESPNDENLFEEIEHKHASA
ncbi:MAG: aspartate kinase [Ignavibacteriales bacterium]|nr:aspartate kinase [Ignavibacteriales bacterium]